MSSSLAPASAASKICARLSLRRVLASSQKRSEFGALGLAEFDPIAYIHLCLLPRSRHGRTTESDGGREPRCKKFHAQAGPISGVYPPLHTPAPPAASRNRYAGIFSRQPTFGSPDAAHARTGRIHPTTAARRSQHRNARSSEIPATATLTPNS